MNANRFLSGLVMAGAWAACAPVVAAEPAAAVTDQEIRAWIGKLASDEFAIREEATEKLGACGPAARPALEEAAKGSDPEVRFRARAALARIERGGAADAAPGGKGTVHGRSATSVSIEQGPGRIRVSVTENRDGKSEKTVYEAPDRETFKQKHPEIFAKYLGGGGLGAGGIQLFMNGGAQAFVLQGDEEGIELDAGIEELIEQQAQVLNQLRVFQFPVPAPAPAVDEPAPRRDLGVRFDGVPEALSAQLGIAGGALVADVVPEGIAARAGLARWDIVTSFAGKKIASPADLRSAIRDWTGEGPAAVSVVRGGQKREMQVSLDAAAAGK